MANNSSISTSLEPNITGEPVPTPPSYPFPSIHDRSVFLTLYVIIALISLFGNAAIILIFRKQSPNRSSTYKFIYYLAISDQFFTLLSPIHVHWMLHPGKWFLGTIGCKLYYFTFRTIYAFSVLVLLVITIHRFLATRCPLILIHARSQQRVYIIVGITFFISIAFTSPLLHAVAVVKVSSNFEECVQPHWSSTKAYKSYFYTIYTIFYVGPQMVMAFMYTSIWIKLRGSYEECDQQQEKLKRRRRIANMLIGMVVCFFLCWSPWTIMEAVYVIKYPWDPPDEFVISMNYAMLPVFASAALNPIMYFLASKKCRDLGLCVLQRTPYSV